MYSKRNELEREREREREREDLNPIGGMENFEGKWSVFVKIVNRVQKYFRWSGE